MILRNHNSGAFSKYPSAWILLLVAAFCCDRLVVQVVAQQRVGDSCDPNAFFVRHHCRSTRCFAAPAGCHYIHDHYTLDVHGHCCATPCYLVQTGNPGMPCGSGVIETLAPTTAAPTTAPPTDAPQCRVDEDCSTDNRQRCVRGVCEAIPCDADLIGYDCCVDADCGNAAYQCNTQNNAYECELINCVIGTPSNIKCCRDSDCPQAEQLCESNICIFTGYARFTLTWTGNDDLDIKVKTPVGTLIDYNLGIQTPDPQTGGQLDVDDQGTTTGNFHTESIYFPNPETTTPSAPAGQYEYYVTLHRRNTADTPTDWLIEVYQGQTLKQQNGGTFPGGPTGSPDPVTFQPLNSDSYFYNHVV